MTFESGFKVINMRSILNVIDMYQQFFYEEIRINFVSLLTIIGVLPTNNVPRHKLQVTEYKANYRS